MDTALSLLSYILLKKRQLFSKKKERLREAFFLDYLILEAPTSDSGERPSASKLIFA